MTAHPAPSYPRCQWCGDMFLTTQARDWHEKDADCEENPNYTPPYTKDSDE